MDVRDPSHSETDEEEVEVYPDIDIIEQLMSVLITRRYLEADRSTFRDAEEAYGEILELSDD